MSEPLGIDALRVVLERDPASILFCDLGLASAEAGGWEEAERVLRAGLAFHPEYLAARVLLGVCLARLGDASGAKDALEGAAEALGRLAMRLYPELAAVCEEAGDPAGGLEALRIAAAHGPLPHDDGERLARLESRRREERSRQADTQALELMEQGRGQAAAEVLSVAVSEDPGNAALQSRLSEAQDQAVREREAGDVIALLQRWLHNVKDEPGS
jgi:Flp pilus assembly protein TadD